MIWHLDAIGDFDALFDINFDGGFLLILAVAFDKVF
jgi:hypothetical protein